MNARVARTALKAVLFCALGGCNSFNSVRVESHSSETLHIIHPSPTVIKAPAPQCPVFKPPTLPETPQIPLEELKHIPIHDPNALDEVHRRHIEALRLHIARTNAILERSYREYLQQCPAAADGVKSHF